MKYHICLKENDKNLLHIITDKDLKKPINAHFKSLAVSHGEEEAFKATANLIEDFCQSYWDKGENPDFCAFPNWLLGVFA